jgi:pimeloyl-ACP methyl ester carboxylesterase
MAKTSFSRESRAFLEYLALQSAPIFRGVDVAKGDGRVVLALPGLFGNDLYLRPLRTWLSRIGYEPHLSMIPVNAGCPKRLLSDVERKFRPQIEQHDRPVAIIGHSRGGMLGKALMTRLGDRVSHFITLGSPLGVMLRMGKDGLASLAGADPATPNEIAHSSVVDAGRAAMRLFDPDCDSPLCGCEYIEDLLAPIPTATRVTAIYSTVDPIVAAAACPIDGAHNIAITGTHSGLVFNREAYRHIANALVA